MNRTLDIVIHTVVDTRYDPKANDKHDHTVDDNNIIGDHIIHYRDNDTTQTIDSSYYFYDEQHNNNNHRKHRNTGKNISGNC